MTSAIVRSLTWQAPRAVAPDASVDAEPQPSLRLKAIDRQLYDGAGRQVILRGVNAGGGAKLPPYFPFDFDGKDATSFDRALSEYLDRVTALGVNVLRLPFTWEAVEPKRGRYDETYLRRLERFVDAAGARGLRVVLDAHQDLFARAYGGSGFPAWTLSAPHRKQATENPLWGLRYLYDGDVRRDFDRFWNNSDGLQDAFVRMWCLVAERLAVKDNVVGLELINEPRAASGDAERWAKETLTTFHSRLGASLRQVAPDKLLFFGASGADGLSGRTATERPSGDSWVFAPHSYAPARLFLALTGMSRLSTILPRFDAQQALAGWVERSAAWNTPLFIGELGMPRAAHGAPEQIRATYDALDAFALSAAAWEYSTRASDWNREGMSLSDPSGAPSAMRDAVVRPYPHAVAGRLRLFNWSAADRAGRMVFDADAGRTSELALPATLLDGKAPEVRIGGTADARWRYDRATQKLLITADTRGQVLVTFGVERALTRRTP